jgi:hypothetical protein
LLCLPTHIDSLNCDALDNTMPRGRYSHKRTQLRNQPVRDTAGFRAVALCSPLVSRALGDLRASGVVGAGLRRRAERLCV